MFRDGFRIGDLGCGTAFFLLWGLGLERLRGLELRVKGLGLSMA